MRIITRTIPCLLLSLIFALPASARWQENGLPLDPGSAKILTSATTSDGGLAIAWSSGFGAEILKLDAQGDVLWGPLAVPTYFAEVSDLALASDGIGGLYLAEASFFLDIDFSEYFCHLQTIRIDADGAFDPATDWLDDFATFSGPVHGGLSLTESGERDVWATWTISEPGYTRADFARIRADGYVLSAPDFLVKPGSQVALASDGLGGALIAWEGTDDDAYLDKLHATYGSLEWGGGIPLGTGTGPASEPALVSWGRGAAVAWTEDDGVSDVRFKLFNHDGSLRTGFQISVGTNPCDMPRITAAEDDFMVGYRSRGGSDIVVLRGVFAATSLMSSPQTLTGVTALDDYRLASPHLIDGDLYATIVLNHAGMGGENDLSVRCVGLDFTSGLINAWNGWIPLLREGSGHSTLLTVTGDGADGCFAVWSEETTGSSYGYPHAQRILREGQWGVPGARAAAATDVPADQGGVVNLTWEASRLQEDTAVESAVSYSLWRAIAWDATAAAARVQRRWPELGKSTDVLVRTGVGDKTTFWEHVTDVAAGPVDAYGHLTATALDSTGTDPALHRFQVITHTSRGNTYPSGVVEGYSVDDLAPQAPALAQAAQSYAPLGLRLAWAPNSDADLLDYQVHAGAAPDFAPGAATLVAATTDTSVFLPDQVWGQSYFKVAARDVHENLGAATLFSPDDVTAVEQPAPAGFTLTAAPNPFNPQTAVSFEIPRAGRHTLRVYDASGRLVRTLVDGELDRGRHTADWRGRDDDGRPQASGVYFVKLAGAGGEKVRRVVLVR